MKLASLRDGSRDGRLAVVSKDLKRCLDAGAAAPTLQNALENWNDIEPKLRQLEEYLNNGANAEPFDESKALSPLPRAYQWADGSSYLNHVELVRRARGSEMPPSFFEDPLMYQGGSDHFLAPRGPIPMADEGWGIDMEAEVAVVLGDVPAGTNREDAKACIRLIMLVNDVSLRNLTPAELAKGFGFYQSKPPTAFSPVAVTPNELGDAWDGGRVSLPLRVDVNGKPFGRANAGQDMTFDFPRLIEHAAKTRPLSAGSILGSGTVSNKIDGKPAKPINQGGVGYSCIAEVRMIETIEFGKPTTPFLQFGDTVQIWMEDSNGRSIFGLIDQTVEKFGD